MTLPLFNHREMYANNGFKPARLLYMAGPETPSGSVEEAPDLAKLEKRRELLVTELSALTQNFNNSGAVGAGDLEVKKDALDISAFENKVLALQGQNTLPDDEGHKLLKQMLATIEDLKDADQDIADAKKAAKAPKASATTAAKSKPTATAESDDFVETAEKIRVLSEGDDLHTKIITEVDVYNTLVRDGKHTPFRKARLKLEVAAGAIDLAQTIVNVDDLLANGKGLTDNERKALERIRAMLIAAQTPSGIEVKSYTDAEIAQYGDELEARVEQVETGAKLSEEWKDTDLYKDIERVYDRHLDDTDEFDVLKYGAEPGRESPKRKRESKLLFMALMHEATNGYTRDLSEMLSNNGEANIKKYPYLFEAWVETVDKALYDDIKEAEAAVQKPRTTLDALISEPLHAGVTLDQVTALRTEYSVKEDQDGANIVNSAYWAAYGDLMGDFIANLERKATEDPIDPRADVERLNNTAEELRAHERFADAKYHLSLALERKEDHVAEFTRDKMMEGEGNQSNLMVAMMRKFEKAMLIVDGEAKRGSAEGLYHGTVRHLMVATVFESGIGGYRKDQFGNEYYDEELEVPNNWMLERLSSSRFFDTKMPEQALDAPHRMVLQLAYLGGKVHDELESSPYLERMLSAMIRGASVESLERSGYTKEQIEDYSKLSKAQLQAVKDDIDRQNDKRREFLALVEAAIAKPYNDDGTPTKALDDLRIEGNKFVDEGVNSLGVLAAGDLDRFNALMQQVEITYRQLDFSKGQQEKNDEKMFKNMGIDVTAVYRQYLDALEAMTPEQREKLNFNAWDEALGEGGDIQALAAFLDQIILMPAVEGGQSGKEALLVVLRNMDKSDTGARHAAKTVVLKLADHLGHIEQVNAQAGRAMPEIEEALSGKNVGDDIEEGVRTLFDMAFGPGELASAKRVAGVIGVVALYKLIRKGMSGEGPIGKMVAAGGIGLALNYFLKEYTGVSGFEMLGQNTLAEKAESTHEGALADHGKDFMSNVDYAPNAITEKEHLRALFALNSVPFRDIIEWHENTNPNGEAYLNGGDSEADIARFEKLGIDTSDIIEGKLDPDSDIRARYIVHQTVSHFYEYIAENNPGQTNEEARRGLIERWVKKVEDPDYKIRYSDGYYEEVVQQYHKNPEAITWNMVMEAETTVHLIEENLNKRGIDPLTETVKDWGAVAEKWLQAKLINPGEEHIEEFMESLGDKATEAGKELEKLQKWAGLKLHFKGKELEILYNQHKLRLKRLGEGTWGIFTKGVTAPIKLVYGGLEAAVPWVDTKLRQAEGILILQEPKNVADPAAGYGEADIKRPGNDAYEIDKQGNVLRDPKTNEPIFSEDTTRNPHFADLGVFQKGYLEALDNPVAKTRANEMDKWHHQTEEGINLLTVRADHGTSELDSNSPIFTDSLPNRQGHMQSAAREEAVLYFVRTMGYPQAYVDKFLYSIHIVNEPAPNESVVVHYHLPAPNSAEGMLKQAGLWKDQMDPNKYKDREPITFNASDTRWDRLMKTTGLNRVGDKLVFAGQYGVQAFYFWLESLEKLGWTAHALAGIIFKEKNIAWMNEIFRTEERTNQIFDEGSRAARDPSTARSEFYKDPMNAHMFELARDFKNDVKNGQKGMYLGFFSGAEVSNSEGRFEYEGTFRDVPPPIEWDKDKFKQYYLVWSRKRGNPDIPEDVFDSYMANVPNTGGAPQTP